MSGFLASSSWCELLTGIYQTRPQQSGSELKAHFHSGAEEEKIATAESQLNARLPISLRSLLLETNGVMDMMAVDVDKMILANHLHMIPPGWSSGNSLRSSHDTLRKVINC